MTHLIRAVLVIAGLLSLTAAFAQDLQQPIPIAPEDSSAPAATSPPAPPVAPRAAPSGPAAPYVLPMQPRTRAVEAAASGQGGMTYSGPAGAISTAPGGAMCSVTCPQGDSQVACPAGLSAVCQCDDAPFASCRPQ